MLVERTLAGGSGKNANGTGYKIDPAALKPSKAAEGNAEIGGLLPGLDNVAATKQSRRGRRARATRVSGYSNELTMALESTASPKGGISVQLSKLHLATGLERSYTTTANQVVLNDGGNESGAKGVSPHTVFTC